MDGQNVTVLIDTSFLVALAVPEDQNHLPAQRAISDLKGKRIVPIPVLPELFYMVYTRMDYQSAVDMYRYLHTGGFTFEPLTPQDRLRMSEIMGKYLDAEFDFQHAPSIRFCDEGKILG